MRKNIFTLTNMHRWNHNPCWYKCVYDLDNSIKWIYVKCLSKVINIPFKLVCCKININRLFGWNSIACRMHVMYVCIFNILLLKKKVGSRQCNDLKSHLNYTNCTYHNIFVRTAVNIIGHSKMSSTIQCYILY